MLFSDSLDEPAKVKFHVTFVDIGSIDEKTQVRF